MACWLIRGWVAEWLVGWAVGWLGRWAAGRLGGWMLGCWVFGWPGAAALKNRFSVDFLFFPLAGAVFDQVEI